MKGALSYWSSGAGLSNITPRGKEWPEGDPFGPFLSELLAGYSVLEFGCGTGRLAKLFPTATYIGVDVCRAAIDLAQAAAPAHKFEGIGIVGALPVRDVTLAHTVLLHVPDEFLARTIARFNSDRVIVSEILGRRWRRDGDPPVFNREAADYEAAFEQRYDLNSRIDWPYPHYDNTDLTLLEFIRR